jgi:DNA-binding beta-propeller fold protein YncE
VACFDDRQSSYTEDAATMGQFHIFAATALAVFSAVAGNAVARAENAGPLQLETKIPLGDVAGRIDHLAIDLARRRLFVAELENYTLGIVDLKDRKLVRTLTGLKGPQGVGYVPSTDTLYVANGGDGTVRLFRGSDYAAAGQIDLGEDADNVRVDSAADRVFVAHSGGMLAVIDPEHHRVITNIALKSNIESFQLDHGTNKVFVNLPKAGAIAVVDRVAGKQTATWPITVASDNYPMALDPDAQRVMVGFRDPAKLGIFSMRNGALVTTADACKDADDMFVDQKRQRLYMTCGEGFLDVFDTGGDAYQRLAQIGTAVGARTSLFVPEIDQFFLAVRAAPGEPAAVWVFRPTP